MFSCLGVYMRKVEGHALECLELNLVSVKPELQFLIAMWFIEHGQLSAGQNLQ
jgi:hypothetical protein